MRSRGSIGRRAHALDQQLESTGPLLALGPVLAADPRARAAPGETPPTGSRRGALPRPPRRTRLCGSVPNVRRREPRHAQVHHRALRVETDDLDEIAVRPERDPRPQRQLGDQPVADEGHRRVGADVHVLSAQPVDVVERHAAEGIDGALRRRRRRERRRADGAQAPAALLAADAGDGVVADGEARVAQLDTGRHVDRKRRQRDIAFQGDREPGSREPGPVERRLRWGRVRPEGNDRRPATRAASAGGAGVVRGEAGMNFGATTSTSPATTLTTVRRCQ